jgi:hypothetical protein
MAATNKTDWNDLNHDQKLAVLSGYPVDQIVKDYNVPNMEESDFRSERWQRKQIEHR